MGKAYLHNTIEIKKLLSDFFHLRHEASKFKSALITQLIIVTSVVIFISYKCQLEGQMKLFLWLVWVVMFCHDLLLMSESAKMFSRQPCINIVYLTWYIWRSSGLFIKQLCYILLHGWIVCFALFNLDCIYFKKIAEYDAAFASNSRLQ